MTDDPVRRDREGWQAGVKACVTRLQEDIAEWEETSKENADDARLTQYIRTRIAHTNVLIWQLLELKYPG